MCPSTENDGSERGPSGSRSTANNDAGAHRFSPAVAGYLTDHAIDLDLAWRLGVRSDRDDLTYPYATPRGEGFKRRRVLTSKTTTQPKGRELTLFFPDGRPEPGADVLLTEGEPDALAALSALDGRPIVVAGLPGVGMPTERVTGELAATGCVYLALDADEPGRAAADRLGGALQKFTEVRLILLGDGEDLAGRLYKEDDRSGWLHAALENAPVGAKVRPKKPEPQGYGNRSTAGRSATETSALIDFTNVTAHPVRWAWRDRIPLAKITGLSGRPKIGKGLLYTELIARVTRGDLDGDLDGPRHAIIVTTEDDPGDTLKPRLMAAGADLSMVSFFQMGTEDDPVPFRVPEHSHELGRRIAERQSALVVIDPLIEFIDGRLDTHKSHSVRQALASVNPLAREHGCAILAVIHLNKGASTDTHLRHEASAAFTQVIRGGLLLGRDPDDPEGEVGDQRVLAVSSSNFARLAPSLVYRIDTAVVEGAEGEEIATAGMSVIGESAADSADLLRGHDPEAQTERDDAKGFLRAELEGGARPADHMQNAARNIGISPRTLARAKAELKVEASRIGGAAGAGHWEWALPPSKGATPKDANPTFKSVALLAETQSQSQISDTQNAKGATAMELAPLDDGGHGQLTEVEYAERFRRKRSDAGKEEG